MTTKEIVSKYSAKCLSLNEGIEEAIKEYARQKCKEQRQIIASDEVVDDTYYHKYIINAPEPEFE